MKTLRGILLAIFFFRPQSMHQTKSGSASPTALRNSFRFLWENNGASLERKGFRGNYIRVAPTVAVAALVSGEIDYYTSIGSGVAATVRGLPVRVIACYPS